MLEDASSRQRTKSVNLNSQTLSEKRFGRACRTVKQLRDEGGDLRARGNEARRVRGRVRRVQVHAVAALVAVGNHQRLRGCADAVRQAGVRNMVLRQVSSHYFLEQGRHNADTRSEK